MDLKPTEARRIAQLVRRSQGGDGDALTELVRRFTPLIRREARDAAGRVDEDLAQELYLYFIRLVDRYVPGGDPAAFERAVRQVVAELLARYRWER